MLTIQPIEKEIIHLKQVKKMGLDAFIHILQLQRSSELTCQLVDNFLTAGDGLPLFLDFLFPA